MLTLAGCCGEADDDAGAVREFLTAVRLAPASPESHYDLATTYAKLGRIADGRTRAEREEFRTAAGKSPTPISREGRAGLAVSVAGLRYLLRAAV